MTKKGRRIRTISLISLLLFFFLFFSARFAERFLARKISSLAPGTVSVDSVSVGFTSVLVEKIRVCTPALSIFLREIRFRPVFATNAFAFSGPGDILLKEKKRGISIRGSLSGRFQGGTIDIKKTDIKIDRLGNMEVKGILENWGRDAINAVVDLKGIEIEELNKVFDWKIPFSGKVFGTARFSALEKDKSRHITFDLDIRDISTSGDDRFSALLKGSYDIMAGKADIGKGILVSPDGGKITFSGTVDKNDFKLNFETEKMDIETFLRLLPVELRQKYELGINEGSVSASGFILERVKKNSGSREISPFTCPRLRLKAQA